ncbi:hypothetical protein R8Z50_30375 [Longispora sp. K20-0274]|uniref:hypothetical protein n=1 Tax=Longispora sp. K20-0274 TaxID=3088255 RepID=UPI003999E80F
MVCQYAPCRCIRFQEAELAATCDTRLKGTMMDEVERLRVEQSEELASFGNPPRFDVRMFPLLGEEADRSAGVTRHADSLALRHIVADVGIQFKRELGYDTPPFDPGDPLGDGVLILSQKFIATFPIAAGAAEFIRHDDGAWMMTWIWLHPYERGNSLAGQVWDELEDRYGQFLIDGPLSPAMRAFLNRRQILNCRIIE